MQTKICSNCKTEKSVSEFYPRRNRKAGKGLLSHCKACAKIKRRKNYIKNREREMTGARAWQKANKERYNEYRRRYSRTPEVRARDKRYRESEHGKETIATYRKSPARRASIKAWKERNREKMRAGWHVWKARKDGRLTKPDACEQCGEETTELHGHHHKGYAPEHRLDVIWLCVSCHEKAHHDPRTTD